jgi:deoxycytidylate deaminase
MSQLEKAIAELTLAPTVKIKGKSYTQVATRVEIFRKHFGHEYSLMTEVLPASDPFVRVMATIAKDQHVVATGLAEEDRNAGPVNKTSALENCETSAIGRALANFGLHGGEYASAGEVENAIAQGDAVPGITALKAELTEFYREMHSCSDADQLAAYKNSKMKFLETLKIRYPIGWHGDGGDIPGLLADMTEFHAKLSNEESAA